MIDQDVFNVEWAVLCERVSRDPSQVLAARYYQSLSPRMSTEQFRLAARKLFDSWSGFGMPAPNDFLDKALGSHEARAAADWERCEALMRGSRTAYDQLSDAGQKTVRLMGGVDRLRQTFETEVHFRRQEFLRLHEHAEEIVERENPAHLLPPSKYGRAVIEAAVPALLGRGEDES